jgi:acetyl esterase
MISENGSAKTKPMPGRLGDPTMVLKTDTRADPRMVQALAEIGLDQAPPPAPVTAESPLDDILNYMAEAEKGFQMMFESVFTDLPPIENVDRTEEVIKGVDGNDITLYIHSPKDVSGQVPCIYHTHGGGMAILQASDASYVRWRDELAATGMVVVGVEFRNGAGVGGNHPFPAGLNDCMSGLQWTFDNKSALGISKIIVSGESGGGNLALAMSLKLKKEGKLEQIHGTYALCPFTWAHPSPELLSLYENDDYFLNTASLALFSKVYDPLDENKLNPLCWPHAATPEDLKGLKPHVISVNELDPLRDEGLVYYQKLAAAGVDAMCRTVNGTCHAGDVLLRKALPSIYAATVRDIKGFADSL